MHMHSRAPCNVVRSSHSDISVLHTSHTFLLSLSHTFCHTFSQGKKSNKKKAKKKSDLERDLEEAEAGPDAREMALLQSQMLEVRVCVRE